MLITYQFIWMQNYPTIKKNKKKLNSICYLNLYFLFNKHLLLTLLFCNKEIENPMRAMHRILNLKESSPFLEVVYNYDYHCVNNSIILLT